MHPSIHPSIKACHFISTLLLEFYLIQLIMIKTIQSSAIIGLAGTLLVVRAPLVPRPPSGLPGDNARALGHIV